MVSSSLQSPDKKDETDPDPLCLGRQYTPENGPDPLGLGRQKISHPDKKMLDTPEKRERALKYLPLTIACIALFFQVFVLYPWHVQISNQIRRLR